jgi:hypothetical protein
MTLADLHKAMQIAMTWDGDFLHTFRIHGKAYSTTDQNAGESAAEVALQDLPLRFGRTLCLQVQLLQQLAVRRPYRKSTCFEG